MAERKTREQEELEAKIRAIRAYERKMEDIAWKHETFLPALEAFKQGQIRKNPAPPFELESGE